MSLISFMLAIEWLIILVLSLITSLVLDPIVDALSVESGQQEKPLNEQKLRSVSLQVTGVFAHMSIFAGFIGGWAAGKVGDFLVHWSAVISAALLAVYYYERMWNISVLRKSISAKK